jgi:two-component system response regulator
MPELRALSNAILLVEDNPDDEELALMVLKDCPARNPIVVARDGVEALRYLFGDEDADAAPATPCLAFTPRLILLDLKLPRLDGLEVLRRMRADPRAQAVPVVVLTSSSQEEDILASYRAGANSYVRKPVAFDRFAETIRDVCHYWLTLNEPPPGGG